MDFTKYRFCTDYYEIHDVSGMLTKPFHGDEIRELLPIWTPAQFFGQGTQGSTFQLPSGLTFSVAREFVRVPDRIDHDWLRGMMRYTAAAWNGVFVIPANTQVSVRRRLWERAYGEVFGIKVSDSLASYNRALTDKQVTVLPAMRRAIRAIHPDAPPERTDEVEWLQTMYRQRYPYRNMAVA